MMHPRHTPDRRSARHNARPAMKLVMEPLEGRTHLSATPAVARAVATKTSLSATTGTLTAPVTFTISVRTAAAAGPATGSVNLVDHGHVIQTVALSAETSANAKYALAGATYTLDQPAGGTAYYFGRHAVSAAYVPTGTFAKSAAAAAFTVAKPAYSTLADGVKVADVIAGTGPAVAAGETANVLYTGYLAKNGKVFDDSLNDGGTPFSFTLGGGEVITGFDEGTAGMQVGQTRLVLIRPAEGYGATAQGSIPKNSTLLFVITLESIG